MTFTYARVGLELWGSQSIGECTQRQLDNIKSKRKVSDILRASATDLLRGTLVKISMSDTLCMRGHESF